MQKLTHIHIDEIVRLHCVPSNIISYKNLRFTSRFWQTLQEALGTKLRLSSAYHPQTDGKSKRTIHYLEDLLRICVLDHLGNWDEILTLVEFTYNNNYQASIEMTPFKTLYGRKCKTPLCWFQDGENVVIGPTLIQQTNEKVKTIQKRLKTSLERQKSYANQRRRPLEFSVGEHVFFRVTLFTGVGRAIKSKKLTLKFIGPYQILRIIGPMAYEIALPPPLASIHNIFHVSQLRKYVPDPNHILESDSIQVKENMSFEVKPIRILDSQVKQLRGKSIPMVKVLWDLISRDSTWKIEEEIRASYPNLFL